MISTAAEAPAHFAGRRTPTEMACAFDLFVDDWTILTGASVEMRLKETIVRRGWVEDTTADGRILWLFAGEGEPRKLFEKAEGFHVWVQSERTPLLYQAGRSRPC